MKRLNGFDEMTVEHTEHSLWRRLLRLPPVTHIYVGQSFEWKEDGARVSKRRANDLRWFWMVERNRMRRENRIQRGGA